MGGSPSGMTISTEEPQVKSSLLLLALISALSPPPEVTLKVTPRMAIAPATIRLTVHIEPDQRNREACLSWASEEGLVSSTSCWSLEDSPRTVEKTFKDLPQGKYVGMVMVGRVDRSSARADVSWEIIGSTSHKSGLNH